MLGVSDFLWHDYLKLQHTNLFPVIVNQEALQQPRTKQSLAEELSDATVIIVAQRVATIMRAHRIVVLDGGRIVGIGTHRELLDGNETYREIVFSQLSEAEAAA